MTASRARLVIALFLSRAITPETRAVWLKTLLANRLGIFNYNLTADTGLTDVDTFTYRYASEDDKSSVG